MPRKQPLHPPGTNLEEWRKAVILEQARRKLLPFVRFTFPGYHVSDAHRFLAAKLEQFEKDVKAHLSPRLMVFLPPRFGKPLYTGTMILMGDGTYKPLSDVVVGDYVVTHQGLAREVLGVAEQGDLPSLKITTRMGRVVVAAADHPFLTPLGWTLAGDLRPGVALANVSAPAIGVETLPDAAFRLAGYFLGDGSTGYSSKGMGFKSEITVLDDLERADIKACAQEMGFSVGKETPKTVPIGGGCRPWLKEIGFAGLGSRTKRVPDFVWRGTARQIGHFIGAYFQCDGSINKRGPKRMDIVLEFYSVNEPLLRDVQRLLLRLGIQSRVSVKRSTHNVYVGGPFSSWRLYVTSQDDAARFQEHIPIFGHKSAILAAWGLTRQRFNELLIPDVIDTIEDAGDQPCRCITVAEDHSYTAEDLVVHNSELTSRRFPPWILGRNPDWNVGIVSYGAELAEELSADARRVVMGDEYKQLFGSAYQLEQGSTVELDRSSAAVNHWRIAGHRGGVRAVGVGGALTGRGFDVAVIDDPIKGRKEADSELVREDLWNWYRGTFRTRMEPGGGILWVQTPWHHDEPAARIAEMASDKWQVIRLPALAEEDDVLGRAVGIPLDPLRFSLEDLLALRDDPDGVSPRDWSAQYQQKPTPDDGDVFSREWFRNEPDPGARGFTFQYWDTAHGKKNPQRKGDRSVCTTWRLEANRYRCIDIYVGRPDYPTLKKMAITLREKHHARAVIVEDHSSGQSLIQDLRNDTRIPILPWKTGNESKLERAKAVTDVWETGVACLSLSPVQAEIFVKEHLTFPNGKYDDIVDSGSMALAHMSIWNNRQRRTVVQRPFRIVA